MMKRTMIRRENSTPRVFPSSQRVNVNVVNSGSRKIAMSWQIGSQANSGLNIIYIIKYL